MFYASIGKKPIHLKKELPGHVANRLQSALYREVVYLIGQGVLDVNDADDAVSWGPGLRWGVMGPNLLWHLGGGEGGIEHFMDTPDATHGRRLAWTGQPRTDPGAGSNRSSKASSKRRTAGRSTSWPPNVTRCCSG